jgi:uncharacterized protein
VNRLWYHGGLTFSCTGCGGCCTGEPGYVWVNKAEIKTLAAAVGLEVDEFQRRYVRLVGIRKSLIEAANGDCAFFDSKTGACQVYDARPRQCRTWPFWSSNLTSPEAWADTQQRCPGCRAEQLVPVQTILAQLGEIKV